MNLGASTTDGARWGSTLVLLVAAIQGLGGSDLIAARRRATLIADAGALAEGWVRTTGT